MANMQQLADHVPENNIIPEIQGEVPLDLPESDIDEDYSPVTPEQKIDLLKGDSREPMSEIFLDSVVGTAYLSTKECSETMSSSSSSSLDTESGTYNLPPKNNLVQYENDDEVMKTKIINVDEKENIHLGNNGAVKNMTRLEYEELLERVASYEIELKFAKEKLQSKQDEIAQLKYENLTLVEELDMTIKNLRTSEDNMAKMEEFRNELLETQHQLVSELDSERMLVSELQGKLVKRTNDLGGCGREIDELKHALHDAQENFTKDMAKMESEIANLHEQRDTLDARVTGPQLRNKFLEEEIENYEMEKAKLKGFHESQVMGLLDEIRTLKEDLCQRNRMAEAEKYEVLEKMHTLEAEVNNRDTNIEQMEEHIRKLTAGIEEMVSELKKTQKIAEELTAKVEDQEKELEKQRVVLSERADEKREAIKQLCFSLEYYRNEYQELCQAFIKHKRPAVLAS